MVIYMVKSKYDENNPSIKMLYDKVTILEKYVSENHNDIKWLKDLYDSISNRQWYIVTGIILTILLEIVVVLLSSGAITFG